MPLFHRRIAALVVFALAGTMHAAAADAPKRKPGLWQQTVATSGMQVPPQSMSICTDERTDDILAARANESHNCDRQTVRREGNAFVVEVVCRDGKTTIRTHGRFTGDFSTAYSGEMRSTFDPPMQGMREMTQKIEARWVGPCKPGQKPGDVVLDGVGPMMNMHEMMKADPRRMQELMRQMQQGGPR